MNQDLSKSFYNIQAKHSSLFLDVTGQKIHNGDNVAQWQKTGLDNQKWLFVNVPNEPDTYYIIAKNSGLLLDVTGQKIHNGDNVAQWQNTSLDNQVWKLIPVEPINIPEIPAREPSKSFEPKMTSTEVPESITFGITGVEWISCVFVEDKGMPLAKRIKESPWYRLERTTTWVTDNDHWHYNSGRGEDKKIWTYRKSWTKETQSSFSVTTGYESTLGGDSFGGSIKASVQFTSTFSETLSNTSEQEATTEISIPAGTAKALFRREETLILRRMDGTKVPGAEWITYGGTATASFPDDE